MIKKLNVAQLEEVSKLFYSVFTSEPFNFNWLNEDKAKGYISDMMNDSCYVGFTYIIDNKEIGYCIGAYNKNMVLTQYHIKEIFIKKEYQNLGYGKKMMLEIEDYLKKDDIQLITLYTNCKIPAYDFYLKNDFQVIEDTVHMLKVIN